MKTIIKITKIYLFIIGLTFIQTMNAYGQNGLSSPVNLQVWFDDNTDNLIHISWSHDTTGNSQFLGFDLYENGVDIIGGLTGDTTFSKTLDDEGTYIYQARAAYYDGFSSLSNRGIITYNTERFYSFNDGNGNPIGDIWTIYLETGTLGSDFLCPGDELAIFEADTLVGKMLIKEEPSDFMPGWQSMVAFSEFSQADGYEPGEEFNFRLYDASMEREYTTYDYSFLDDPDYYSGDVFPDGEPNSMLSIDFVPELLSPTNLQASTEGHDVELTWQAPGFARDLIGYNVYRNGNKINNDPIAENSYEDDGLLSDNYEYYVTSVYDEGNSPPSEPVNVIIDLVYFEPEEPASSENPMNVIIHSAAIMDNQLEVFDEVALYKHQVSDSLCMAAYSITNTDSPDTLIVFEQTETEPGFSEGDTLFYRIFDYSTNKVYQDVIVNMQPDNQDTSRVFLPNAESNVMLNWIPYAPVNLSANTDNYDVLLNWDESPDNSGINLLGYNVYRDNQKINSNIIQTENYTDYGLPIGNFSYKVKAIYEQSLSRSSDAKEIQIESDFFLPVQETESEDNMTFEFFGAEVDGVPLTTYDQVAVFSITDADTLICVGAGSVRDSITDTETLTIKAYRDNPDTEDIKDGFAEGDSIYYKFWDESTGNVYSYLERSFPFDAGQGYNHDTFSFGDTCKVSLDFFTPPPVQFRLDDDTTYCRNTTGNIEITTEDFKNIDGLSFSLELDTLRYNYDTLLVRQDFLVNSNISFSGNTLLIEWASEVLQSLDDYDTLFTVVTDIHENGNSYLNWNEESDFSGMEYLTSAFHNTDFFIEKLPDNPGIISGDDQVCNGTAFSIYSISAIGNADSYVWELGNNDAGEVDNNGTESMVIWNNDFEGFTTLLAYGENQCGSGDPSEKSIDITNTVITSVSIDMSEAECEGDTIVFTATGINGGNNPVYNWYINNEMHFSHNTTLISDDFTDEDQVYCELISSSECVQNNPAQSETITLDLNPVPAKPHPVTGPEQICNTVEISYYMTPGAQNADNYLWNVYPSYMGEVMANGNNAEVQWNTDTSGTAFIEVRGLNDCGTGPARQFITVRDYCTEIDEPGTPSLTIFPNPFRNRITISLPTLKTGAAFTLSDLKGNRLLQEPLESNRQEVSLQQLPRGMYILKIINGKEVNYRKVVKK